MPSHPIFAFRNVLAATAVCTLAICSTPVRADDSAPDVGGPPNAQMKRVLDELAKQHGAPIETLTPEHARQQPTVATAMTAILKEDGKSTNQNPVDNENDMKIPSANGKIPVRVYTPGGQGPFPVIVYYHGGGFVLATIDTYEASCRALANDAKAVVVSVEYRKAPEYKYPAATDDALAAYQWVTQHAAEIKGDPKRIAVAGESAGGNLATVTAMRAKEGGLPLPVYQLLIYPVVSNDMTTASYQKNADAKPLNKAMMTWFFDKYLSNPASAADPHVCPLKASDAELKGMPPAMIITASIDPLQSEGKAYADRLKQNGVAVTYKNYAGVTHEFFGLGAVVDTAKQAEKDAGEALRKAFGESTAL
ncbi:MAG: alpha/beta hydrolase fold domain-containing protein [Tepidisphaeraceae bacterium]